ncbi:MAG: hypothetical protein NZ108_05560 [Bacteroidia bacterium]|nr:hypothetical protein [Bacteroidia bacterium]
MSLIRKVTLIVYSIVLLIVGIGFLNLFVQLTNLAHDVWLEQVIDQLWLGVIVLLFGIILQTLTIIHLSRKLLHEQKK